MPRYKDYSYGQHKLLPIAFREQILPGTFEYTLNYLIDHEVDLSVFEARYRNDETGAPAYDPGILLKIVLYAYARGIVSSREIERCCRENIIFMALSADTQPHFSTLAGFISLMSEEIPAVFRDVLLVCDEMGLISKELFAIDGCKIPSNACKEWSGTRAEFEKKKQKMEGAMRYLLKRHRERDKSDDDVSRAEREAKQLKTLREKVRKIKKWLDHNDDKPGKGGKPKKSNLTDNESAKMKSWDHPGLRWGSHRECQASGRGARRGVWGSPRTRLIGTDDRGDARKFSGDEFGGRHLREGQTHSGCGVSYRGQYDALVRGRDGCRSHTEAGQCVCRLGKSTTFSGISTGGL